MKFKNGSIKVIAIRLTVLVVLLICLEGGARLLENKKTNISLGLNLAPYTMFRMPAGAPANGGYVWLDIFTNKKVPSTMTFNNFGYAEDIDYNMFPDAEYLAKYAKKPGEKLVLITGGSVVHGVGATSNQNTIPKQLEKFLNANSNGTRYRVLNMAMGSWIAYQQFVGLSLFGRPLKPDWVIVMDGHNDAGLACGYGTGAGNPMGWPKMLYFAQGGKMSEDILPALSRRSALVRLITGLQPQDNPPTGGLVYNKKYATQPYAVTLKDLTFEIQDQQVRFYLEAQKNVIEMFNHANILLSLQPVMYDHALTPLYRISTSPSGTMRDEVAMDKEMDIYMEKNKNKACSPELSSQLLAYFLNRAHVRLKGLVAQAQKENRERHILYVNAEWSMPVEENVRKPYFIDNAHLSDKGQERIGRFFAEQIHYAEAGKPFDYANFIKRHPEEKK